MNDEWKNANYEQVEEEQKGYSKKFKSIVLIGVILGVICIAFLAIDLKNSLFGDGKVFNVLADYGGITGDDINGKVSFSAFRTSIDSIQACINMKVLEVVGDFGLEGENLTTAQAVNYIASGGNFSKKDSQYIKILPKGEASKLSCTKIKNRAAEEALGIELPKIYIDEWDEEKDVRISFYVTNSGAVFIWPPYEYENEFYLNNIDVVCDESGKTILADSDDVDEMYKDKFTFVIDDVEIQVGKDL